MTKFRVRIWCEACQGDVEGCFGGDTALIAGVFETREEARAAAIEYCGSLPYSYRVEESEEGRGDSAWAIHAGAVNVVHPAQ